MEILGQNIDNGKSDIGENKDPNKILNDHLLELGLLEKDLYSESDGIIDINNPDSEIDKEYILSIEKAKNMSDKINLVLQITNKFLEIKKQYNNPKPLNNTDFFNNLENGNYSLQELRDSKEFLSNSENIAIQSLYTILSKIDELSIDGNTPKIQDIQNIIKDIFSDKSIDDSDATNLINLNTNLVKFYNLGNLEYNNTTIDDSNDDSNNHNEEEEYMNNLRESVIRESPLYKVVPTICENLIHGLTNIHFAKGDVGGITLGKNIGNIIECFDGELNINDLKIITNSLLALMHLGGELVHIITNFIKDINVHLLQPYELKDKDGKVIIGKGIVVQGLEEGSSIIIEGIDTGFSFIKDITPDNWNDKIDSGMEYTKKSVDGLKDGFILVDAIAFGSMNGIIDFVDWGISFPFELDATIYKIKKAFTGIKLDSFLSSMGFDNINNIGSPEKISEMIGYILTLVIATIYTVGAGTGAIAKGLVKLTSKFPSMFKVINKMGQNIDKFEGFIKDSTAIKEYKGIGKGIYNMTKEGFSKIPHGDILLIKQVLENSGKVFQKVELYTGKSIEGYDFLFNKLKKWGEFNSVKYTCKTIYGINEYGKKFVATVTITGKIKKMIFA